MKNILGFPWEVKSLEPSGFFSGYASMFNYVDSQQDLVNNGAFSRTIAENSGGADVKLLWQHDPAVPVGFFTKIEEDDHGLYVEGYIQQEVEKGREAYALMKSGAVRGLSIGYKVKDYALDHDSGVRMINDVDLFEISLVTFPANDMAKIIQVKSAVEAPDELDVLHDYALWNVRYECMKLISQLDDVELKAGFNPSQARAEDGKWTDGSGGGGARSATKPRTRSERINWDEIDPPMSDWDAEKLAASATALGRGARALNRGFTEASIAYDRAKTARNWVLGKHTEVKWSNRMNSRGWSADDITDTIRNGERFEAPNYVNKGNGATRYVNKKTDKFIVIDNKTKEVLQIGDKDFIPKQK